MDEPYVLDDLELVAVSLVEEPVNPDCGFDPPVHPEDPESRRHEFVRYVEDGEEGHGPN